jgi:subtilisin family serine protease
MHRFKNSVFLFFLFISIKHFAQSASNGITDFLKKNEHILNEITLKDKIVVQFESGLTVAEKEKIFLRYDILNPYHSKMEPAENDIALAGLTKSVKNYEELRNLLKQLERDNQIKKANPVVRDAKHHPVLILNPVSFMVKSNVSFRQVEEVLNQLGMEANIVRNNFIKNVYQFDVTRSSPYNTLEIAAYLHHSGLVTFAEPNYGVFVDASTNDPFFNRQWNIRNEGTPLQGNGTPDADMDVDSAWTITMGSPFIKIAIIDSGTDTLHPDLIDNLDTGFDATGRGSKGYPNLRFASDAHGTACAGIAAAKANNNIGIAGIAPLCKIVPVKIFYYVDSVIPGQILPYSESQWMAAGISWAWQEAQADVMSNSWGLPDLFLQILPGNPALVDTAIQQAYTQGRNGKGTPMFFSSGNDGESPIWPSRLSNTIAVNATNMCDTRKDSMSCDNEAWEGNWGNGLDLGAPGVRITTTDIKGSKGYSASDYFFTFNGTSAACPNAAAVAALILTLRDDLYVEDIRFILGNSADKVGGYDYSTIKFAGNWSPELGYGRVNAYKALQLTQSYSGHPASISPRGNNLPICFFPNPVNNELHIATTSRSIEKVALIDLTGKVKTEIIPKTHADSVALNMHDVPQGIYYCHLLLNNGQMIVKKIIKQ